MPVAELDPAIVALCQQQRKEDMKHHCFNKTMDEIKDLLPTLQLLLPGFLTTVIFYWLADVPKPSQFERVIHALICTPLINLTVQLVKFLSLKIGDYYSFGKWEDHTNTIYSIAISICAGVVLAYACNKDFFYSIARKRKITSKASHSDQIHIFRSRAGNAITLQLKDSRRLMGYIAAIPSSESSGQYLIQCPRWIVGEEYKECEGTESIMISHSEVQWVEFTD